MTFLWDMLAWIILGAAVGWLAGVAVRGTMGAALNMVIGATGAMLGGLVYSLVAPTMFTGGGFTPTALGPAFLGALALLVIAYLVTRRSGTRPTY